MMQINLPLLIFRDKFGEEIIVRPYSRKDREKLVEMYETLSPDSRCLGLPPQSKRAIESWVDYLVKDGFSLVAECGDRIVGHVAVIPTNCNNVELTIFIHQDYQNRGLGQFMLKQIIEFCRRAGFNGITLVTERKNVRAIRVYRKMGFRFMGDVCECDMYLPLS
ncbi:MAG: GNAT family N-acetyltransferase [Archaeoglobales archaeon]|nr:MAG: GNAT family N-acetyltransferase [Archaeoglobales archaeon]